MTLTDVLTMLKTQGHISSNRTKDIQTSIRYLAEALGKTTPDQCHEADFVLTPSLWKAKLDTYFLSLQATGKQISAHTIRNTRNNLSYLFRIADEQSLFSVSRTIPLLPLTREQHLKAARQNSPYAQHYQATNALKYGLPLDQWPCDIQTMWQTYRNHRYMKTRPSTFASYQKALSSYLGFLINIEKLSIQWDDLFTLASVERYVRWQSQRVQRDFTHSAQCLIALLYTLASHFQHPSVPLLKAYKRDLPTPEPLHEKQHHLLSLRELETVAHSTLQDARKPVTTHSSTSLKGLKRAIQFQSGLMLLFLVRIPLRSRNWRELQVPRNLYQDDSGHWHLHFRGRELKIGTRNGKTNEYHVDLTDYCPELLPILEEFRTVYRRCIPNADTSPYLFLNKDGQPYGRDAFTTQLSILVLRRTNKRFYPHLIRTIWATECITERGEFTTAAHMLGDTVYMVQKHYQEIVEKDYQQKANNFLTAALR